MIHKNRGNRRFVTKTKALRKEKIALQLYGEYGWYGSCRGKYRKGKIHCSCPMCASKTNFRINKSLGAVDPYRHGSRIPSTCHRAGRKNWKTSDLRKIQRMNFQFDEAC